MKREKENEKMWDINKLYTKWGDQRVKAGGKSRRKACKGLKKKGERMADYP